MKPLLVLVMAVLYAIVDVKEPPAKDDTWLAQHIMVKVLPG